MTRWFVLVLVGCGTRAAAPMNPPDWPTACRAIADDIERLRGQYAQLVDFRATSACAITYRYRTHAPTARGGWSSGVPHPDPDGIWFYIGIYDPAGPDAMSQIHTQPVVANWWIRDRKVMFLVLEGEHTHRAGDALLHVLERHGMVTR